MTEQERLELVQQFVAKLAYYATHMWGSCGDIRTDEGGWDWEAKGYESEHGERYFRDIPHEVLLMTRQEVEQHVADEQQKRKEQEETKALMALELAAERQRRAAHEKEMKDRAEYERLKAKYEEQK